MPRYTPWNSGLPPEASDPEAILEDVLRPNLQRAFPLPTDADAAAHRFARLIEALANRTQEEGRRASRG